MGRIYRTGEAMLDELRNKTGMIDVSMRQKNEVDFLGLEGKVAIVQRLQRFGTLFLDFEKIEETYYIPSTGLPAKLVY